MYKILEIGNKDYKLEYSMEASLYSDCTDEVLHFIEKTAEVSVEIDPNTPADQLEGIMRDKMAKYIHNISNLPQRVLTLFYAGLIEHHGNHSGGDRTVCGKDDAKKLLAQYLREHRGGECGDFFSMMNLIIEQMGNDGFFDLIGLDKAFRIPDEKQPKKPQDHQKKVAKISEK